MVFQNLNHLTYTNTSLKLCNVMGRSYLYKLTYTDWKAEKNETKLNQCVLNFVIGLEPTTTWFINEHSII